ncbi:MAG: ABC transporter ATP-binding protein [Methanoregulaceae archaeon]|jgi:NitT/TauT family transport system ATP-binding protein|nr:ABC transporter ATP-binding protein [Methanoregulaceae archaeon]
MRLECRNLNKIFSDGEKETRVISDITFEAREGEFLCILGPSGCGKSTLLRIIAGLMPPTSGEVTYSGEKNSGPLNSMVFQEYGVFPWMNVIDNVAFGLEMRGVSREERYHRSLAYLKKMGLAQYAYRNPHELSVGMRQRIALARAFVNHPSILLMDEPFGSLDAQTRLILQDELLKIWKEQQKTVIFVTHDIDEAILLGDRVLVLTSVPGRIKDVLTVDIPRPRNLQMESSKEFIELRMKIWNIIRTEVEKSMSLDHDAF